MLNRALLAKARVTNEMTIIPQRHLRGKECGCLSQRIDRRRAIAWTTTLVWYTRRWMRLKASCRKDSQLFFQSFSRANGRPVKVRRRLVSTSVDYIRGRCVFCNLCRIYKSKSENIMEHMENIRILVPGLISLNFGIT